MKGHHIMIRADFSRQLMIRAGNHQGTLAELTHIISSSGINLIAICAYAVDKTVYIMFVTEDNNASKQLLEKHGFHVEEEEVVLLSLENRPGALQRFTDKIAAAGIDLRLVYGSVDQEANMTRIILISSDNHDMMLVIKTELERG